MNGDSIRDAQVMKWVVNSKGIEKERVVQENRRMYDIDDTVVRKNGGIVVK